MAYIKDKLLKLNLEKEDEFLSQELNEQKEEDISATPLANSQKIETYVGNTYAKNNGDIVINSVPVKTSIINNNLIEWEDETITINSLNNVYIFLRFLTLKENDSDAIQYTNGFYYTITEKIPATFIENLKIKDMGFMQGTITLTGDDYLLEKIIMNFLIAYEYYSQNSDTKEKIVSGAHFLLRFGWSGVNNPEYYMESDEWIECNLTGGIPQLQYTENNTLSVTLNFYSTSASFIKLELTCKDNTTYKRGTLVHIFENLFLLRANKNSKCNKNIVSELKQIYEKYKIKFFVDEEIFNNLIDFIDNGKVPNNYFFSNTKLDFYEKWFLKEQMEDKKILNNMLTLLNAMISTFPKLIVKEKDKEGKEVTKEYSWNYKFVPYEKGNDIYYAIVIYNLYNKEYVPIELNSENVINIKKIKGYRFKNTPRSLLLNFNINLNNLFYQYMGNSFINLNKEFVVENFDKFNNKDNTLISYIKLKKDSLLPIFQGSASIIGNLYWLSLKRKQKFLFHYEPCSTQIYVETKSRYNYKLIMSGIYTVMSVDHDISPSHWTTTLTLLKEVQKLTTEE